MRKKDDAKKELILNYIHEYYGRFGKTPVVLEIASGTAISSATVHRYLVAMNESGELNELLTEIGSFHGTASELMEKLCARSDIQIKSANALTRQLNPYRALLEFEYGIRCELERNAKGRTLHLTKIANDDSDDTLTLSTDTVNTVTD